MEDNIAQLRKNVGRSILRSKNRGLDSESEYSDSEMEIEENPDMKAVSLFMGVMGINIRKDRGFMTSVKGKVRKLEDKDKDQCKKSIDWMKLFYENVTHVETVNATVSKVSAFTENQNSAFLQGVDPNNSGIKIPKSVLNSTNQQVQKP